MKIRPGMEKEYKKYVDINQDPYGRGVITFGERWADALEKIIDSGIEPSKAIIENAKKCEREADTEGITGFMYGCAVNTLSKCWEYGEILRKWHNKEYNYDGDGVVNPAIMTIK